MTDLTHLKALELRLSHERGYLHEAKSQKEIELRKVWIEQIEREIEDEKKFLGIWLPDQPDMSDDELLKRLGF